ncbi:MAG TPA: choice-of-anchor X domain-containing protein [Burkholderiaceae bacterium]
MGIRWRVVVPVAAVCTAALWWVASPAGTPPVQALDPVAQASVGAPAPRDVVPVASAPRRAPFSAAGLDDRQARLALWQQRLDRAKQTLAMYQAATRYPFDSRPASEHSDQWLTHQPVATDAPLRMPGTGIVPNLHVHTTQQKVFATGADTVLLTVTATDDNGAVLPLRILSSTAHSPQDTGGGKPAPLAPVVTQPFVDDGSNGDAHAGDGTFTARLDPMAEGFGNFAGLIRTELVVQSGEQQGYVAFDVVYAPQAPATWTGANRDRIQDGSLEFVLGVDVNQPGRYVITGRVDDAAGKPVALVTFNNELGAGAQQVVLQVYGRLVRDLKPVLPLTLHDVEGFLLKPDAYPDRALMASLDGPVATSRKYAPAQFSDALFSSDETKRYLAEYGKDVAQAQQEVAQLQAPAPRP